MPLRAFFGPAILGIVGAVALAVAHWLPRYPEPGSAPLQLAAEAETTLTFRTTPAGPYHAAVVMNQPAAELLFPCVVVPERWTSTECDKPALPIELALTLEEDSGGTAASRFSGRGARGGAYGGGSYAVDIAHWDLEPNTTYHLRARSLIDGRVMQSARPALVVNLDPGKRQAEMLLRFLGATGGIGLMAVGLIWAVINMALKVRRRA